MQDFRQFLRVLRELFVQLKKKIWFHAKKKTTQFVRPKINQAHFG